MCVSVVDDGDQLQKGNGSLLESIRKTWIGDLVLCERWSSFCLVLIHFHKQFSDYQSLRITWQQMDHYHKSYKNSWSDSLWGSWTRTLPPFSSLPGPHLLEILQLIRWEFTWGTSDQRLRVECEVTHHQGLRQNRCSHGSRAVTTAKAPWWRGEVGGGDPEGLGVLATHMLRRSNGCWQAEVIVMVSDAWSSSSSWTFTH